MTVASVRIVKHETLNNWFWVTLKSRPNSIGQTTIELLVSEEELRHIRHEADKALGNKNDNMTWKFGDDGK